jgi:NAD+ diphosphatase
VEKRIGFQGSPLDRAADRRRDAAWLASQLACEDSRFLPLWRLDALLKTEEPRGLAWARWSLLEDLDPAPQAVLLGVADGVAHFAVDVSQLEKPVEELGLEGAASFEDLRFVASALPAGEAAMAAQARTLVDWHARHGHCAVCGGRTRCVFGGGQRNCIECAAEHYPRTDPVVIVVVSRGGRCLLGRSHGWPEGMYSALAGFVEAGETLEEAVRREVREESGILLGAVHYQASQPWPFPSSLMIGFVAEGESEAISLDDAELSDARWFSLDEVRRALSGEGGDLVVPPPFAIAHQLIRAWAEASVSG